MSEALAREGICLLWAIQMSPVNQELLCAWRIFTMDYLAQHCQLLLTSALQSSRQESFEILLEDARDWIWSHHICYTTTELQPCPWAESAPPASKYHIKYSHSEKEAEDILVRWILRSSEHPYRKQWWEQYRIYSQRCEINSSASQPKVDKQDLVAGSLC